MGYIRNDLEVTGYFIVRPGFPATVDALNAGNTNLGNLKVLTGSILGGQVSVTNLSDVGLDAQNKQTASITTLGGLNVAKSASADILIARSNLSSLGSLTVSGNASFNGNIFSVPNAAVTLGSSLNVSGPTSVSSISLSGLLTSNNTTDVNTATPLATAIFTSGGLYVTKSAQILGPVSFANNLVSVNSSGLLTTSSAMTSTLTVNNKSNLNGDVSISGVLTILNNSTTTGTLQQSNTSDSTSTSTGAFVTAGGVAILKSLNVGLIATVAGNLVVKGSNSQFTGNLLVSGNHTVAGNLILQSVADASSSNPTSSAFSVSGGIYVAKQIISAGNITLPTAGSIITAPVANIGSVSSTSIQTGSLSVTNNTILSGPLTSNSTQDLNLGVTPPTAAISTQGSVYIGLNSRIAGSLTVGGSISANLNLSVSGNSTITGALTAGSTLSVNGNSTYAGIVQISNTTDYTSANPLLSSLSTLGGAYIAKNVNIGNILTANGVTINGNTMLNGSATVTGTFTFGGTITTSGTVVVNNTSDVNLSTPQNTSIYTAGGLYVSLSSRINGSLTAVGNASVGGQVFANGAGDIGSGTTNPSIVTLGGIQIAKGLSLANNTIQFSGQSMSGAMSSVNGPTFSVNVLRIRSNDAMNTGTRLSFSNIASTSATTPFAYDSSIAFYSLGSELSSSTAPAERLLVGANASGGYINYLTNPNASASTKPFNVLGGSNFSQGGSLSLATALQVQGAVDATTNANSLSSSVYTAGGAYVTKNLITKTLTLNKAFWATWTVANSQTFTRGAYTQLTVNWNLLSSCGDSAIAGGLSASTYTAPYSGLYFIMCSMLFTPATTLLTSFTQIFQSITILSSATQSDTSASNSGRYGASVSLANSIGVSTNPSTIMYLNAGDRFTFTVYTSNLNVTSSVNISDLTIGMICQTTPTAYNTA